MTAHCAKLVIAGTQSGVGKTLLALGLARALARQGLRVQTFKVGPDFLDPTYLTMASGRTCYNLDGWMTSREYVGELFARATSDADVALIEGVMGLFDGASPTTIEGSTAEIAAWLDAPVLLVANAHGAARSLAATAKGFATFEPGVRVAGVIANQGGSERHRRWLSEALNAAGGPPLLGMVARDSLPALPSRHLGLVAADQAGISAATLDRLADVCQKHVDIAQLLEVADCHSKRSKESAATGHSERGEESAGRAEILRCAQDDACAQECSCGQDDNCATRVRLGIARDEAFHFYYPDNLEALERAGVEWVPFSPLRDARLPMGLDGLYFGGGYPEVHAAQLAANSQLLAEIRALVAAGRSVYAECGGLMYLGHTLTTLDGSHSMAGVLPIETAMLPKLKTLGYTEVAWTADTLWGAAGQTARGHEFHFSEITGSDGPINGWQPAYNVLRRGADPVSAGYAKGNVLAGYVHLHWASRPEAMRHLVSRCKARL